MAEATAGEALGLRLRRETPAVLHAEVRGWAYFDGPSGTQMISSAIDTMAGQARTGLSNRHGFSPAGDETEDAIAHARAALAALFRADGYHVVFGQNMTSLAFSLGHAFARQRGGENVAVVVTELEHAANVDAWVQPFADKGGHTSWIRVDPETFELRGEDLDEAGAEQAVAIVAATAAANAVGAVPDLERVRALARATGALFVVDAVHAVPHTPPDLMELDADVLLCSGYKFYGPHVGVALVRATLADELPVFKVRPAPERGPERLETGSQNHEGIAALGATIEALARLAGRSGGAGARHTLSCLGEWEATLGERLVAGLRSIPSVRVFGHAEGKGTDVATVAFNIHGRAPAEVAAALRRQGIFVTAGDFYATALASRTGVAETGGWVRAGIAGYTSEGETDQLVAAVAAIAGGQGLP